MSPLKLMEIIIEELKGTAYEPWVDALIFLILIAGVFYVISFLIGKNDRKRIAKASKTAAANIGSKNSYTPGLEALSARIAPYIDIVMYSYCALIGLYSGVLVGVLLILSTTERQFSIVAISSAMLMVIFLYMRANIAYVSWAFREIKTRKG